MIEEFYSDDEHSCITKERDGFCYDVDEEPERCEADVEAAKSGVCNTRLNKDGTCPAKAHHYPLPDFLANAPMPPRGPNEPPRPRRPKLQAQNVRLVPPRSHGDLE